MRVLEERVTAEVCSLVSRSIGSPPNESRDRDHRSDGDWLVRHTLRVYLEVRRVQNDEPVDKIGVMSRKAPRNDPAPVVSDNVSRRSRSTGLLSPSPSRAPGRLVSHCWSNRSISDSVRLRHTVSFLGRETFLRNKRAAGRAKDLADIDALRYGD